MDKFKKLCKNLAEIGFLQREVKRRAMIYQCEYKESVAIKLGLSRWAFYNMAYADLSILEDADKAREWYLSNKDVIDKEEEDSYYECHRNL